MFVKQSQVTDWNDLWATMLFSFFFSCSTFRGLEVQYPNHSLWKHTLNSLYVYANCEFKISVHTCHDLFPRQAVMHFKRIRRAYHSFSVPLCLWGRQEIMWHICAKRAVHSSNPSQIWEIWGLADIPGKRALRFISALTFLVLNLMSSWHKISQRAFLSQQIFLTVMHWSAENGLAVRWKFSHV